MAFFSNSDCRHVFLALCGFLLFILPSVIYYPSTESMSAYGDIVFGSFLCFLIYKMVQVAKYRNVVQVILYGLMIVSVVGAVKGIYQYHWLHIDRPKSIFRHPNFFAIHMELLIPVVLSVILGRIRAYSKIALSIVLILLSGGLLVTQSRGAWLATIFSLIVMMAVERKYKALLLACIPTGVLVLLKHNMIVERLQSIFDLQVNIERVYAYSSSLTIIKTHPLTGIGLMNFANIYPQYMLPGAQELLPHAHNLFLAYATEAGILAAVSFAVFIALAGRYVCSRYASISNENHRLLVLGISCSVLSLLLHGLVDHTLRRSDILLVFMFLMGMGLGIVNLYTGENKAKN